MPQFVSVIIPVFNRKVELSRAVKSVLAQTYSHFELIIVDDASDDDVYSVIKNFDDSRIRYIRNDNNYGVSYSRNRGLELAQYNFIALLDSDDEWLKHKLKVQLDFFTNHPNCNVCHTEEIWVRNGARVNPKKKHKKSGGDIFIASLELCLMSPSSIMLRKSVFEAYGNFDEELIVCEDYDMWLRILSREEVGFIENAQIIKYGGHDDQLSRKYPAMDKYRVLSLLKMLKTIDLDNEKKDTIIAVGLRKLGILSNGAQKRGLEDDFLLYQRWITEFNSFKN